MDRALYYDRGGYAEVRGEGGGSRLVPFPLCLAIRSGDDLPESCPDFILNISESWVFVRTDNPLPEGTPVHLHVYIPPEIKLLAEIDGTVSARKGNEGQYPEGMLIRFQDIPRSTGELLQGYIEGKRPLIDRKT